MAAAVNGRIRVVCTGKEAHPEQWLDTLAVTPDGHWRSTVGEKQPRVPASDGARRRLVLGDHAVSGATPTYGVKCPDTRCRREFQRHGEELGKQLLALAQAGVPTLDISRLPF